MKNQKHLLLEEDQSEEQKLENILCIEADYLLTASYPSNQPDALNSEQESKHERRPSKLSSKEMLNDSGRTLKQKQRLLSHLSLMKMANQMSQKQPPGTRKGNRSVLKDPTIPLVMKNEHGEMIRAVPHNNFTRTKTRSSMQEGNIFIHRKANEKKNYTVATSHNGSSQERGINSPFAFYLKPEDQIKEVHSIRKLEETQFVSDERRNEAIKLPDIQNELERESFKMLQFFPQSQSHTEIKQQRQQQKNSLVQSLGRKMFQLNKNSREHTKSVTEFIQNSNFVDQLQSDWNQQDSVLFPISRDRSANHSVQIEQSGVGTPIQEKNGYILRKHFKTNAHSKEKRQSQQSSVYGQNLLKMANAKRAAYQKNFNGSLKKLPESQNFIKQNKTKVKDLENEKVIKKLDRIKRLQEKVTSMTQENFMKDTMINYVQKPTTTERSKELESGEATKFSMHQRNINIHSIDEAYLQGSIEKILSEKEASNSKTKQLHYSDRKSRKHDRISNKTLEQFQNLKRNLKNKSPIEVRMSCKNQRDFDQINDNLQKIERSKDRRPRSQTAHRANRGSVFFQNVLGNAAAYVARGTNHSSIQKTYVGLPKDVTNNLQALINMHVQSEGINSRPHTGDGQKKLMSSITTKKLEFQGRQFSVQQIQANGIPERDLASSTFVKSIENFPIHGDARNLPPMVPNMKSNLTTFQKFEMNSNSHFRNQDGGLVRYYSNLCNSQSLRSNFVDEDLRKLIQQSELPVKELMKKMPHNSTIRDLEHDSQLSLIRQFEREYEKVLQFNEDKPEDLQIIHQMQMVNFTEMIEKKSLMFLGSSFTHLSNGDCIHEEGQESYQDTQLSVPPVVTDNQSHILNFNYVQKVFMNTQQDEGRNAAQKQILGPIFDLKGAVIYPSEFRKHKWVEQKELDRFREFRNESFSFANSQNGRIYMENPFKREHGDKMMKARKCGEGLYVFPKIKASAYDIAKFILSQQYLSFKTLKDPTTIGIHPALESQELFTAESLLGVSEARKELIKCINEQSVLEFTEWQKYHYLGLGDIFKDLKDRKFVADYRKDPTHLQFTKEYNRVYKPNRKRYVWNEVMKENTREWKMIHDPRYTIKKYMMFNRDTRMPEEFRPQYLSIQKWEKRLDELDSFDNYKMQFVGAKSSIINKLVYYNLRSKMLKRREPKPDDSQDVKELFQELEGQEFQIQKPTFQLLPWPTHQHPDAHTHDSMRDELQAQIVEKFARIYPFVFSYDLLESSCFTKSADQTDYFQRKKFNTSIDRALDFDLGRLDAHTQLEIKNVRFIGSLYQPRNFVILRKKLRRLICQISHPIMHIKLKKTYFKFNRFNENYYDWYSQYIETQAAKKNNRVNYHALLELEKMTLSIKDKDEQVRKAKVRYLGDQYFSREALDKFILYPRLVSLNTISRNKCDNKFAALMKMHEYISKSSIFREWKIGKDHEDLNSQFFQMQRDWEKEPESRGVDYWVTNTVYLSTQLPLEQLEEVPEAHRSFEIFMLRHPYEEDKLQTQLVSGLKTYLLENKMREYKTLKNLRRRRVFEDLQNQNEHEEKVKEEKKKYLDIEKKKTRKRALSTSRLLTLSWAKEQPDELSMDLLKAEIKNYTPFTTDHFDDRPPDQKALELPEVMFTNSFTPCPPPLQHLTNYLQQQIEFIETEFFTQPPLDETTQSLAKPRAQFDQIKAFASFNSIEAIDQDTWAMSMLQQNLYTQWISCFSQDRLFKAQFIYVEDYTIETGIALKKMRFAMLNQFQTNLMSARAEKRIKELKAKIEKIKKDKFGKHTTQVEEDKKSLTGNSHSHRSFMSMELCSHCSDSVSVQSNFPQFKPLNFNGVVRKSISPQKQIIFEAHPLPGPSLVETYKYPQKVQNYSDAKYFDYIQKVQRKQEKEKEEKEEKAVLRDASSMTGTVGPELAVQNLDKSDDKDLDSQKNSQRPMTGRSHLSQFGAIFSRKYKLGSSKDLKVRRNDTRNDEGSSIINTTENDLSFKRLTKKKSQTYRREN